MNNATRLKELSVCEKELDEQELLHVKVVESELELKHLRLCDIKLVYNLSSDVSKHIKLVPVFSDVSKHIKLVHCCVQ